MRKDLHLGQAVRFLDWRDGRMRDGTVVAMKDTQVTIQEQQTRRTWALPYTALEPPQPSAQRSPEPESPPMPRSGRNDWVKRAEVDAGVCKGVTSDDALRMKELEREVKELRRAENLKLTCAFFAYAGLDR